MGVYLWWFYSENNCKKIWKSMDTETDIEKLKMDGLQKELCRQINGKKYLLILDYVWNNNHNKWLKLETLWKKDVKGNKIIITTRSERVAHIMSRPPWIYVLEGLSNNMVVVYKNCIMNKGKNQKIRVIL